ncbi:MAG TPA: TIGR00730 family Rossman fold protein [Acetobacteraceae bacterium]|nr:TIGR00730 family Rossman fold protein [Acetobacteraceae bacterium]
MRRVCVFCGARTGARPEYEAAAIATGREIASRGLGLVYGGGAIGLMGAVARGAREAGGEVIGIIPHGLVAREAASRDLPDLRIVSSMHERKALMAEMSDGFLALPGGHGTLEEAVETLTWLQLGIHGKGIVFVDIAGYWSRLMAMFDHMVAEGFLRPPMRDIALLAPDAASALDRLAAFTPPDVPRWMTPDET